MEKESLATKLERKASEANKEVEAVERRRRIQAEGQAMLMSRSPEEFKRLQSVVRARMLEANDTLITLPKFGDYATAGGFGVSQGNVSAEVIYLGPVIGNVPANIRVSVSFGKHRDAVFASMPMRAFEFVPILGGDGIVWAGSGQPTRTTEQLAEHILENLTEYFLEMGKRSKGLS